MLTNLTIHNLAVVEHLELNFNTGMTALTGETGAGKSILIDALSLTLGERAESGTIRHGSPQAEITAVYDLQQLPSIDTWLKEHALDALSDCIIRRIITEDGRSRSFINGRAVPLTQLRELGEFLVNIHGQHQHQTLLKPECQRIIIDDYANHKELLAEVKTAYQHWQKLRKEVKELSNLQGQEDKLALLKYQIQEIDELALQEQELTTLETEHKTLANADQWFNHCETALLHLQAESLSDENERDAFSALNNTLSELAHLKQIPQLKSCHELLNNALIQLEEAANELIAFKETLHADPTRLMSIDQRLSQIHALARKHRISAEFILTHREALHQEASKLEQLQTTLSDLTEKVEKSLQHYLKAADALSISRKKTAIQLEKLVTESLKSLEMKNGQFKIEFNKKSDENKKGLNYSAAGIDEVEFLVSTNPGLPLQPLRKIASGGELSRISLAIQVITAQKMTTPTLIFDEVDVGISGKTAEIVGQLLRKLGEKTQVLCVTHLPQVAAKAHHHYKVEKHQNKTHTTTTIKPLKNIEKIQEIARMLGGVTVTQNALLHAEEMLQGV